MSTSWFDLVFQLIYIKNSSRARVGTDALKGTNRVSLLNDLSWVELSVNRKIHKLTLMNKMLFKLAPPYLGELSPNFVSERSS